MKLNREMVVHVAEVSIIETIEAFVRFRGGWPIFALRQSHGGCPILAFLARVGGDGVDT